MNLVIHWEQIDWRWEEQFHIRSLEIGLFWNVYVVTPERGSDLKKQWCREKL